MLNNMNDVTKAVSNHPIASAGSIASLAAFAGLAYVMWDKNRRVSGTNDDDQEFSESHADGLEASAGMASYNKPPSTMNQESKRSKKAALWAGLGVAVSGLLGAAVYYRYAAKSNSIASWLPSTSRSASRRLHGVYDHFNTLKQGATGVYDNLAKKAANIR